MKYLKNLALAALVITSIVYASEKGSKETGPIPCCMRFSVGIHPETNAFGPDTQPSEYLPNEAAMIPGIHVTMNSIYAEMQASYLINICVINPARNSVDSASFPLSSDSLPLLKTYVEKLKLTGSNGSSADLDGLFHNVKGIIDKVEKIKNPADTKEEMEKKMLETFGAEIFSKKAATVPGIHVTMRSPAPDLMNICIIDAAGKHIGSQNFYLRSDSLPLLRTYVDNLKLDIRSDVLDALFAKIEKEITTPTDTNGEMVQQILREKLKEMPH